MNIYSLIFLFIAIVGISLYLHERKKRKVKTKHDTFTAAINTSRSYYPLFEYLAKNHDLILLQSELQEIINICQSDTNKIVHQLLCAMDFQISSELNGVEYYVWKLRHDYDKNNDDALRLYNKAFINKAIYKNADVVPLDYPVYCDGMNLDGEYVNQYLAKGRIDQLKFEDWKISNDDVNDIKYLYNYNEIQFNVYTNGQRQNKTVWSYYVRQFPYHFGGSGYPSKEVAMFECMRHYKMYHQIDLSNIM